MSNAIGSYLHVHPGQLHQSPFHHRTDWGNMEEFAESLKLGIIEPPVVRPRAAGGFEVVCGERRRRGSLMAGLTEIPVIVRELSDVEAVEWQARENIEREGLHPLDEAHYFAELTRHGFDPGDIGKRFGRKRREVVRSLKLLSLSTSAQAAYSKREIDDDAALALATCTPDKQDSVIATLRVGAMQTEEIPAYVSREFSAPLDNLPWHRNDAEMPGGACDTCPKRSAVQRDLFAEGGADRCLDVECWRTKMECSYQRMAAEPAYSHLDREAPMLFLPQSGRIPVVMKASGYVDSEASCPHLTGYTWEEALRNSIGDGDLPTIYLTRDQDGRPRLLYSESSAARIVRKSEPAKAQARQEEREDPGATSMPRAESKVRRAIVDQVATVVAASDVEAWGWIVERLVDLVTKRSLAGAVSQYELKDSAELVAAIREGSNRKRKQIAIALLVREVADVAGDLPPALAELCELAEVDLASIEKAIRDA